MRWISSLAAFALVLSVPLVVVQAATPTASAPSASAGKYATSSEAKSHCGSQPVVWANSSTHVFHGATSKYYGKTKHGAYMCQQAASAAGYHAAKNGS